MLISPFSFFVLNQILRSTDISNAVHVINKWTQKKDQDHLKAAKPMLISPFCFFRTKPVLRSVSMIFPMLCPCYLCALMAACNRYAD